jgi:serine/threonine protein kinase HipA of HipAB toxin-antitoxin module
MKLAMPVGKHYKLREIQPRHFTDLAKSCGYPAEQLLDTLRSLAMRLPDEALAVATNLEGEATTHGLFTDHRNV